MKNHFRNFVAFVVLIGLVYFVANNYGTAAQIVGVKGASTQKAQEVTKALNADVNQQVNAALKKTGEIKLSDIMNELARFQKIPQDINNIKNFTQQQINNITKKK